MRAASLALPLFLAACATGGGAGDLLGREWRAADVNGMPVSGSEPPTLTLGPDGQASGSGGCNRFTARYRIDSEDLRFTTLTQTKVGCEPALQAQEERYFSILRDASGYSRYGNGFAVVAPDGRAVRFKR